MAEVTDIDSRPPKRQRPSKSLRPRTSSPESLSVRAREAYDLRIGGHSLSEISEILSVPVPQVTQALREIMGHDAALITDSERRTLLAYEVMRLDKLQTAVWPAAMMGDPKSVDSAVKIIQARAKITGLEQADPIVNKNLVLVVGENEQDYIAALKAASDD